ncbi:MAG: mucoidy inhibitor MuiA family protein [Bacteroidota bacterium]
MIFALSLLVLLFSPVSGSSEQSVRTCATPSPSYHSIDASASEQLVRTAIGEVTVFRQMAQIQRKGRVTLTVGKNTVVFTDLSQSLVQNSIQLNGRGTFTLLSLSNRVNYIDEKPESNANVSTLIAERDQLQVELTKKQTEQTVAKREEELVLAAINIVNKNKLSGAELEELITTYRANVLRLENLKRELEQETKRLKERIRKLNQQINESGRTTRRNFEEIIAEIESETEQTIEFTLEYLVNSAGWSPAYDVRTNDTSSPLSLTYKANIYQRTGYDWNDVRFIIDSGNPSVGAQKPELTPGYIGFYEPQWPVPARSQDFLSNEMSIQAEGIEETSRRPAIKLRGVSSSNEEPLYIIDGMVVEDQSVLSELDQNDVESVEVLKEGEAVALYGSRAKNGVVLITTKIRSGKNIQNQLVSNQTSFSYVIEEPYTVPSDGKNHTVDIKREEPKTEYLFSAAPKLTESAYLVGRIPNWNELNLIAGQANVYFNNSYVGNVYLNPGSVDDTLEVSLGRDERIIIERKKLKDFEERRFFGSKVRESLSFELNLRNTKPEPITIIVQDQIPVSTDESIKVSPKELSGGELNKETGIVTWKLTLAPNEAASLRLNYQLEYPKGRNVVY